MCVLCWWPDVRVQQVLPKVYRTDRCVFPDLTRCLVERDCKFYRKFDRCGPLSVVVVSCLGQRECAVTDRDTTNTTPLRPLSRPDLEINALPVSQEITAIHLRRWFSHLIMQPPSVSSPKNSLSRKRETRRIRRKSKEFQNPND